MTHKRASRIEKGRRIFGTLFLVFTAGIISFINISNHSDAARTADNVAEIVDCDSVIKKSALYNAGNDLGSLGVFGVIGFTSASEGNYKGGLATPSFTANSNDFGTEGVATISYLGSINGSNPFGWNSNMAADGSMLVLGSGVNVSAVSGWNQWNANYNIAGSSLPASKFASGDFSTPESATTHIYNEGTQAFINLSTLKDRAKELSANLATQYNTNTNITLGNAQAWEALSITTSGSGLAVLNQTARSDNWDAGYTVNIGTAGQTLLINFDMAGKSNTQIGNFTVNHNGNSNVILNVYDSSKADKVYTGNIEIQNNAGFVLAPSANLKSNNLTGIAIANTIQIGNATKRPYYGNFPVTSAVVESFGVCDDGGDAPVGQHKLTVNHYIRGESEPFDTTFEFYDDGAEYSATPLDLDYLTYLGLHSGSIAATGIITEDIEVSLDYKVNNVSFVVEHVSTEDGNPLIEKETVTKNALDTYTVTPKRYDNYKYKNASAALAQQVKNFGSKITLYYDPWVDPTSPVTSDMVYEKTPYYVESKLGTMGGFHMVGFTEIDAKVRVYGNIVTNKITNMSEFGLVHFPLINYTKVVGSGITNPKFSPNDNVNTVLVVGRDVDIDLADNGNRWTINGAKVDIPQRRQNSNPTNVWREKDVKFLDLDAIKTQAVAFSKKLAGYEDTSTEVDFSDQNNKVIRVLNNEGLNSVNLTYQDFDESHDIFVDGFDKEKKATLVINIDMAGHQGDFSFAGTRLRWGSNDIYNESFTGGENITREDAQLNNTITLNFVDSSSPDGLYHGNVRSMRPMLAFTLIPEGQFTIVSSAYAGAILADRISGTGNSYMVLFDHAFYNDPDPEPENVPVPPKTLDENLPLLSTLAGASVAATIVAIALVRKRR